MSLPRHFDEPSLPRYFDERGVPCLDLPGGERTPRAFAGPHQEHLATRRHAGLFDFSFMGCWEVIGRQSLPFAQFLQTRDLRPLAPGRLCYTLLCRRDGSVLNDATVWLHGPERLWIFTGRRTDGAYIAGCTGEYDVQVRDLSGCHAVLAVQGPGSERVLRRFLAADFPAAESLADLRYFAFGEVALDGTRAWIARLGYSGEPGYELIVPVAVAAKTWERLRTEGRRDDLRECGFDAANSLRIESGHVLFSRELGEPVTPYELGLGRLVALHRPPFIGSERLRRLRQSPPRRRLVGISFEPLSPLHAGRAHAAAIDISVTSEAYSPIFRRRLGLGFVAGASADPGRIVYAQDARRARICRLPFHDPARVLPRR